MPIKVFRDRYLHGRKLKLRLCCLQGHGSEFLAEPGKRMLQVSGLLRSVGRVSHLPQLLALALLETLLPPMGVPAALQEEALSSGTSVNMMLPPTGEGE